VSEGVKVFPDNTTDCYIGHFGRKVAESEIVWEERRRDKWVKGERKNR
jgi:hypothetical protein